MKKFPDETSAADVLEMRRFTTNEPGDEQPKGKANIGATPYRWRDPSTIPPRDWLYGRHYVRRYVTATIAPGGLGKSSLALVEAVAMASGKPLLGQPVRAPFRVWYWNGEDPIDEIERRVAAICVHYGLSESDLGDRLHCDSGRTAPIKMAEMYPQRPDRQICSGRCDRPGDPHPRHRSDDHRPLRVLPRRVRKRQRGHRPGGKKRAGARSPTAPAPRWNWCITFASFRVAAMGNSAEPRGLCNGRGGRSVRVLNGMSTTTPTIRNRRGTTAHIFPRHPRQVEHAETAGTTMWGKLVSVPLGNDKGNMPQDLVGVATPWKPPDIADTVQPADLGKVRAVVAGKSWALQHPGQRLGGPRHRRGARLRQPQRGRAHQGEKLAGHVAQQRRVAVKTEHDPIKGRSRPMVVVGA